MATLRARRRSRTSRPILFALLADGFMSEENHHAKQSMRTLDDQERSVNPQADAKNSN